MLNSFLDSLSICKLHFNSVYIHCRQYVTKNLHDRWTSTYLHQTICHAYHEHRVNLILCNTSLIALQVFCHGGAYVHSWRSHTDSQVSTVIGTTGMAGTNIDRKRQFWSADLFSDFTGMHWHVLSTDSSRPCQLG